MTVKEPSRDMLTKINDKFYEFLIWPCNHVSQGIFTLYHFKLSFNNLIFEVLESYMIYQSYQTVVLIWKIIWDITARFVDIPACFIVITSPRPFIFLFICLERLFLNESEFISQLNVVWSPLAAIIVYDNTFLCFFNSRERSHAR
jgi:hypothetical protein